MRFSLFASALLLINYVSANDVVAADDAGHEDVTITVSDEGNDTETMTTKAPGPEPCDGRVLINDTSHPDWPLFYYADLALKHRNTILTPFIGVGNIIALVGNVGRARSSSPHFLMTALAISDSLAYGLRSSYAWFQRYGNPMTDFGCAALHVFAYQFTMLAVCLLVFLTVERLIIITFPLRAMEFVTHGKSVIATCVAAGFFFLVNLHFVNITEHPDYSSFCTYNENHIPILASMHGHLYSLTVSYLPLTIIGLSNIGILVQFRKARERQKQMTGDSEKRQRQERQLLNMMILVSVSFGVLTLPPTVIIATTGGVFEALQKGCNYYAQWAFWLSVKEYMFDLNNGVNGYLYCLSSSRFRKDLLNILSCGRYAAYRKEQSTRISQMSQSQTDNSVKMQTISKPDN